MDFKGKGGIGFFGEDIVIGFGRVGVICWMQYGLHRHVGNGQIEAEEHAGTFEC